MRRRRKRKEAASGLRRDAEGPGAGAGAGHGDDGGVPCSAEGAAGAPAARPPSRSASLMPKGDEERSGVSSGCWAVSCHVGTRSSSCERVHSRPGAPRRRDIISALDLRDNKKS